MRCFSNYKDDRICDLCDRTNHNCFVNCLNTYKNNVEHEEKLRKIKNSCQHKTLYYDEYTPFDGCNKKGNGHGRNADDCNPSLECEQYCK